MENFESIMNFGRYYSAGEMEFGTDGPEMENDKLYMSIYHYLEFKGYRPHNYNTFKLGNYLTSLSGDYKTCKYLRQNFRINKFNLELLEKQESQFNNYKKY